ncbi:MAG: DUF427 domain-containing protein [Solirubrobacteraceae bacterium]
MGVGENDKGAQGPVQAVWNGKVIAQSDHTVVIEGNHYFPPDDVSHVYLELSDKQSVCPWKGTASYYDVVVEGQHNAGAAWCYPSPKPAAQQIAGYVAFWHGVKVKPAPAAATAA